MDFQMGLHFYCSLSSFSTFSQFCLRSCSLIVCPRFFMFSLLVCSSNSSSHDNVPLCIRKHLGLRSLFRGAVVARSVDNIRKASQLLYFHSKECQGTPTSLGKWPQLFLKITKLIRIWHICHSLVTWSTLSSF